MDKRSPRFRKDLTVEAREEDGVTVAFVTDPATGVSFTFYEFEFELANQFNGQLQDDIIAWAVGNYETALTPQAIDEFADKLRELGFLEPEGEGDLEVDISLEKSNPRLFSSPPSDAGAVELSADSLQELDSASGPVAASSALGGIPERMPGAPSSPMAASAGFSARIAERRQPPGPESVVMTPFEDVSMRFRAAPPERQRSSTGLIVGVLLMIAGGAGGGYYYWMRQHPRLPEALRLRVVAPQPTAVYRWFASTGTIVDLEARTMAFESQGKVVEMMPSGTKFAAGDTLGKLQGANALEGELAKIKSKLTYFEQMRDSMKASGNKANLRDAEDKVAARKKLYDETQAALGKLIIKAPEAGTIVETPVKVGVVVAARAPVLKWRGRNLHGDFTMDQEDFAKASKLEFCRVEVTGLAAGAAATPAGATAAATAAANAPKTDGGTGSDLRYVDCTLPPPAPPPAGGVPNLLRKFIVTLPNDAGLVTGQQLHLARKRYDGVFLLPTTAVQDQVDTEGRIWVMTGNGTAEPRMIGIAESRDEVLVSRGLKVGDEVLVDPPRDLTPGTLVEPIR
jgi:multidrug efflux pump subunit AcrA (membrane-fusion protein)